MAESSSTGSSRALVRSRISDRGFTEPRCWQLSGRASDVAFVVVVVFVFVSGSLAPRPRGGRRDPGP